MANEYLRRNFTSSGNLREGTFSFWMKGRPYDTNQTRPVYLYDGSNLFQVFFERTSGTNPGQIIVYGAGADIRYRGIYRDPSAWSHYLIKVDNTTNGAEARFEVFVNGVRLEIVGSQSTATAVYPTRDANVFNNVFYINGTGNGAFQVCDYFYVDGQALTPDVFGFNKVGKGYISVGSTQATDFRPGQWVPKSPRIIISDINNRGGFGVNGFYLPMNDSNNFGADFHCTPNSIIKLQENLPQPKSRIDGVGDYTGALREDPFKQYLVLALPFVSGGLQSGFGDYSAVIKGSGTPKTITNSNVSIASTASYYGTTGSFNGSNTYLTATMGTDLSFGTEDFTIEFWAYVLSNSSNAYIFDTNVNGMVIGYGNAVGNPSANRWRYYNGSNQSWTLYTSNPEPVLNQWSHIALCRKNGRTTFYVNGVATSTELDSTNYTNVNSSTINIGRYGGGGIIHNGYLQDFRIYKGIGKYTGGFDVPKPYTPIGIATWRAVPDTTANNFATLNPLLGAPTNGNVSTFVNGNLTKSQVNSSRTSSTISTPKTGKWYAEFRASGSGSIFPYTGVALTNSEVATIGGQSNAFQAANLVSYTGLNYHIFNSTTTQSETNPPGLGDVLGVALDVDNGVVYYYKNGTLLRTDNTLFKSENYVFSVQTTNDGASGTSWYTLDANFGQNPTFSGNTSAGTFTDSNGKGLFKYQPPSGFLALCEDNLPAPTISDPGKHFKTVLYTGDGLNGRNITGVGFQPDLVWIKNRNSSTWHVINDSVRGPNRALYSNQTYAENQTASNPVLGSVLSFNSDGFSLAVDPDSNGNNGWNNSGNSIVAWCWKAGNTTTTNTNGSITSVVSANQDAGFSIVSFTMPSGTYTVGHGLGKTPKFIITKQRDGSYGWWTQHASIGAGTAYLDLSSTAASTSLSWGGIPNSSTFAINNSYAVSGQRVIAYCWAEIEGFSKFGSYVGNGSADGPFVFTNGRPAFVMVKRTDSIANWFIFDNSRNSTNPNLAYLVPNASDIESTSSGDMDFLSNGFKIRNNTSSLNASGGTYIFACWMESPFTTANSK